MNDLQEKRRRALVVDCPTCELPYPRECQTPGGVHWARAAAVGLSPADVLAFREVLWDSAAQQLADERPPPIDCTIPSGAAIPDGFSDVMSGHDRAVMLLEIARLAVQVAEAYAPADIVSRLKHAIDSVIGNNPPTSNVAGAPA